MRMSKEALKKIDEALRDFAICGGDTYESDCVDFVVQHEETIQATLTAAKEMIEQGLYWRPAEELPLRAGRFLVKYHTTQGTVVREAYYDNNDDMWCFWAGSGRVYLTGLHKPVEYMPLPPDTTPIETLLRKLEG